MDVLRQEIIETERTRNELLKWKLVLVGGLGAAGLGFAGSRQLSHADLLLAAIPPVAVYVDLLCRNLAIKMLVIGTFAPHAVDGSQNPWQILTDYESHVDGVRRLQLSPLRDQFRFWKRRGATRNAFALEDYALSGSTFALSLALIGYALYLCSAVGVVFAVSGGVGILSTVFLTWCEYRRRFDAVCRRAEGSAAETVGSTGAPG